MFPNRCISNICGYCKGNPKIVVVTEKQSAYGFGGAMTLQEVKVSQCEKSWGSCPNYLKNSEVNLLQPDLMKKKTEKVA